MKVYIGPYKNYVGPHDIAEKLLFWKDKDSDIVHTFGMWLADFVWLGDFCGWIDSKRSKKVSVRIDSYDVWSMDSTLALIILPMLRKLAENKHGAPFVEFADVPENLRPTETDEHGTDSTWFVRWEYVLNEMIFAFENMNGGWEEQFWTTAPKLALLEQTDDTDAEVGRSPWDDIGECDWDARKAYDERIHNGLCLFGKYYRCLWT
jgi:hypothetical protein